MTRGELTILGATGAALLERYIGNEHDFQAAAQQRALTSLQIGVPIPADAKYNEPLDKLFQIIYQHAAACHHLPPSRVVNSFKWGVCRYFLQVRTKS